MVSEGKLSPQKARKKYYSIVKFMKILLIK